MKRYALDTGPLVAFLNRRDQHHAWAKAALGAIAPPVLCCESVVSEACFLLQRTSSGSDAVLELIQRDLIRLDFSLANNLAAVRHLMKKYRNVPMSLADACLVRMSELDDDLTIVTADSDFTSYRRGRKTIPIVSPD